MFAAQSGVMDEKFEAQSVRTDAIYHDLKNGHKTLSTRMDEMFAAQSRVMDEKFEAQSARMDATYKDLLSRIDANHKDLLTRIEKGQHWLIGIGITSILAVVGLIFHHISN